MKKIEIILLVFAIVSLALRLAQVVGGSFLLMVSLLLLACFYYLFSFAVFNGIGLRKILKKESYKDVKVAHVIVAILAGIGLANLVTGIQFRVLSYAGAVELLFIGIAISLVVFAIAAIQFVRKRDLVYRRVIGRILLIGTIGVISIFI